MLKNKRNPEKFEAAKATVDLLNPSHVAADTALKSKGVRKTRLPVVGASGLPLPNEPPIKPTRTSELLLRILTANPKVKSFTVG